MSLSKPISAVEFFSGIGGFAESCRQLPIQVIAAFDQSDDANTTYRANFGFSPFSRNLDSISADSIPDADIWWASPPCKPYTIRGKQLDDRDSRSLSLRNLIGLIPTKLPSALFIENVEAFATSNMRAILIASLAQSGYVWKEEFLCPTTFGIPMKRPRYFLTAMRVSSDDVLSLLCRARESLVNNRTTAPKKALAEFVDDKNCRFRGYDRAKLIVGSACLERYAAGFNIVAGEDDDAVVICFTSGYAKSVKASGSLLKTNGGTIRRFSPEEILRLLGYSEEFHFPDGMSLETRWRLIGNSVDVRCVKHVLTNFCSPSTLLAADVAP